LLSRLQLQGRRAGRRPRHHRRGGVGLDPDPDRQLFRHRNLLRRPMNEQPKISFRDVHKRFGRKVVLDGINLDVPRGKSLVVIGGSGSGKSVMLKCVLGLVKPETGQILIDGRDSMKFTTDEREKALRKFGMLFQGSALFDSLKVWEN